MFPGEFENRSRRNHDRVSAGPVVVTHVGLEDGLADVGGRAIYSGSDVSFGASAIEKVTVD